MDLYGVTTGAIGAVNQTVPLTLQVSTGNVISPDGTPTPTYATPVVVPGQVQPLTFKELKQVDALNLSGSLKAVYLEGHFNGIVRPKSKGGDLITDQFGNLWLVVQVLEFWPDWTRAVIQLQLPPGS